MYILDIRSVGEMRIKNFGLYWPYRWDETHIEEIMKLFKFSHNEATSYDYAQNWKDKSSRFAFQTRCIAAMYQRLFPKNFQADVWKIQVDCVENQPDESIKMIGGVISTEVLFDFENFNKSDNKEKKIMALEALYNGIQIIVNTKGWDIKGFDDVYREIKNRNYLNEWIWVKKKSPNKTKTAEVRCVHEVEKFEAYLDIKDAQGLKIKEILLLTELPDELIYHYKLGDIKWLSNSEIMLCDNWISITDKGTIKVT